MWTPDFKALPKDGFGNPIEDEGTAAAILPCVIEFMNAEGEPLSRLNLLPYGSYRGSDGSGPWYLQSQAQARDVLEQTINYQRGDNVPINYDHQPLLSPRPGTTTAGYVQLQTLAAEGDGIYADVIWTPPGYDALAKREYRYLEAEVRAIKATGRITRLIGAGLTNSSKADAPQLASQSYNLTAAELEVCEMLGRSPATFARQRADQRADQAMVLSRAATGSNLTAAEREACEMLGIDLADFPSDTQQLASVQRANEAVRLKLTAAEREVCEMTGMDPADFLRARGEQGAS